MAMTAVKVLNATQIIPEIEMTTGLALRTLLAKCCFRAEIADSAPVSAAGFSKSLFCEG
jgi:hypothetical protein